MVKSKNILLYEMIAILALFTIIYFVAANRVSYAFSDDGLKKLYDNKIALIDKMAKMYGENNQDLFEEDDTLYITVKELAEKGYLLADDEDGNVKDPMSEVKTLNDIKIRITNQNGKIDTKVLM